MKLKIKANHRGFPYAEFTDRYRHKCSIQISSLADDRCIWLGIDEPECKIMTNEGWKPYDIPPQVLVPTRMHLNQEQVKSLLPLLKKFAETGEI